VVIALTRNSFYSLFYPLGVFDSSHLAFFAWWAKQSGFTNYNTVYEKIKMSRLLSSWRLERELIFLALGYR
jgi:hypothetical protein